MGVDYLPEGGKHQPFYQALVEDGTTRYVAQCNIRLASPAASVSSAAEASEEDTPRNDAMTISDESQIAGLVEMRGIGKHFRCFDLAKLRFILNAAAAAKFPDDIC